MRYQNKNDKNNMGKYTFYMIALENISTNNHDLIDFIKKKNGEILYTKDSDIIGRSLVKESIIPVRNFLIKKNIITNETPGFISWFRKKYLINRFKD